MGVFITQVIPHLRSTIKNKLKFAGTPVTTRYSLENWFQRPMGPYIVWENTESRKHPEFKAIIWPQVCCFFFSSWSELVFCSVSRCANPKSVWSACSTWSYTARRAACLQICWCNFEFALADNLRKHTVEHKSEISLVGCSPTNLKDWKLTRSGLWLFHLLLRCTPPCLPPCLSCCSGALPVFLLLLVKTNTLEHSQCAKTKCFSSSL